MTAKPAWAAASSVEFLQTKLILTIRDDKSNAACVEPDDVSATLIAGYQLRAPCIYIRHAPGNLFIPSLGDGLRRIAGFAFQAGNQALD